jgi:hypothetical protein
VHNYVLVILATARLTRFVTEDWLGHWWLVEPARRWALARQWQSGHLPPDWEDRDQDDPRVRLVMGLDCPFCVGFHIGWLVMLSYVVARAVPGLMPLWRFVMGALALNYVVAHVSSRIDH